MKWNFHDNGEEKMTRHNKDKCKRYNCQECYKERLKELE